VARLARLPSSCKPLHRRLRIPHLPKGDDSPLSADRNQKPPGTYRSRRLSTPRIPRSDPNDTRQIRSQPSEGT
jgi:hypothetical protein